MSFLRILFLSAPLLMVSSLLLLSAAAPTYADLSMKPRTCSNCSGFGNNNKSTYQHRPSSGISGHKSFGNHHYKSYRPKTYNSFKHNGKPDYYRHKQPHYNKSRDYHHRPDKRYKHSGSGIGIGLSIVAPIVYSGVYESRVAPQNVRQSAIPQTPPSVNYLPQRNIDAWSALGNYQTDTALTGFVHQSRQQPQSALPKVGYALATALAGEHGKAVWAMEQALAANTSELHYFQADANLQLVIDEVMLHYPDTPLMQSALLYLQQDFAAADAAADKALQNCTDCSSVQNLQDLIARKQSG